MIDDEYAGMTVEEQWEYDKKIGRCWCYSCEADRLASLGPFERMLKRRFLVCSDCGNKRCPKAQHHDRACTNSNATGQPGGG